MILKTEGVLSGVGGGGVDISITCTLLISRGFLRHYLWLQQQAQEQTPLEPTRCKERSVGHKR